MNYLKFLLFTIFSLLIVKAPGASGCEFDDVMAPGQKPFCLYGAWFNPTIQPANTYIAPDQKWKEMTISMCTWMAKNSTHGVNNVKYKILYDGQSVTSEQVFNSKAFFCQAVDFVDVRDVIRNIPGIIQILYRGNEGTVLAEKSQELLSAIFSDGTISIYFKADLARVLVMMQELYLNPKQKFMYADPIIQPHNISELFSCYLSELKKFGIVMANSSMLPLTDNQGTEVGGGITLRIEVSPPGFENSAFIAQPNELLMEALAFGLLRPFMDRDVIRRVKTVYESASSQIVFSMHKVVFLYEMLCFENSSIYLDEASRSSFKNIPCADFFNFMPFSGDFGVKWPETIHVSVRHKEKEHGRIPGLESALISSAAFETCSLYSKYAVVGEASRSISNEERLYAVIAGLQGCKSGDLLSQHRRSFVQILRKQGFNDFEFPDIFFPVMGQHGLLVRASRFRGA
jgi:hypothetical protein